MPRTIVPRQTYGAPCRTGDPLACVSPYNGIFSCANPNGTLGTPSRCVFTSPSAGDPCVDDLDCVGGNRPYIGSTPAIFLRCDKARGVCAPQPGQSSCTQAGDCAAGAFCNATGGYQVRPGGWIRLRAAAAALGFSHTARPALFSPSERWHVPPSRPHRCALLAAQLCRRLRRGSRLRKHDVALGEHGHLHGTECAG